MAKVIYRILQSKDKTVTFLDEFLLKTGTSEEISQYWRDLADRARKMGLLIDGGIFENGVLWMKAYTRGKTSIRRFELFDEMILKHYV